MTDCSNRNDLHLAQIRSWDRESVGGVLNRKSAAALRIISRGESAGEPAA